MYVSNILSCLTTMLALVLFFKGFFPLKSTNSGFAKLNEQTTLNFKAESGKFDNNWMKSCIDKKSNPSVILNRLIIIVIDALRADFLLAQSGSHMTFTRNLIDQNKAFGFTARSQAPTVTMPRIKAFTAGTVPSFVDVLLNFASNEFTDDNMISQFYRAKHRLVFHGDDTWLKLFPGHFAERSDGTTSFFVADYTQVDYNVTRHIDYELSNAVSWDVMVLHYLGLDHIGHSFGPRSILTPTKLREMDTVIKKIYTTFANLQDEHFLLVVLGDHGMSDIGSHGGASRQETLVPIAFLSPLLEQMKKGKNVESYVEQIDLVPTLSSLFGLPIPQNNLGVSLFPLVKAIDSDCASQLLHAHRNALQIVKLYAENVDLSQEDEFEFITSLHEEWILKTCSNQSLTITCGQILVKYLSFCENLRTQLVTSFVEYDQMSMILGMTLSVGVTLYLSRRVYHVTTETKFHHRDTVVTNFVIFGTFLHALSLGSSSFVEEEHQIWYFLWPTLILLIGYCTLVRNIRNKDVFAIILPFMAILILHRILRAWNQTGNKWAHLPDIGDWINEPANVYFRSFLVFIGICLSFFFIKQSSSQGKCYQIIMFIGAIVIFAYQWNIGGLRIPGFETTVYRGVLPAQIGYVVVVGLLLNGQFGSALVILFLFLNKSHNIPVIGMIIMINYIWNWSSTHLSHNIQVVARYWLANVNFYYLGNSNSLGTIDVSAGYVGLNSYNPILNGFLISLHTYSGPLLVASNFNWKCTSGSDLMLILLLRTFPMSVCLITTWFERYHLFVWSVFAPKVIYETVHTFLACFIVVGFSLSNH